MRVSDATTPEIGVLLLKLVPQSSIRFNSARSVHAALLRRIELVNPEISRLLHDAPHGAPSSDHPWAISPLLGQPEHTAQGLNALPGRQYTIRVAALLPQVVQALDAAFDADHPLGREPLFLESVPCHVIREETGWETLATYGHLLNTASPRRRIALRFLSPTGFRTARAGMPTPTPRLCLEGYLRKWTAFSGLSMPAEAILGYAEEHLTVRRTQLRPASVRLGWSVEEGVVGWVEWWAEGGSPFLLRLVNALANYASYCGTGMKTALGMGQTTRL
ncbi:MAG: hypothetical protein DRI39_08940 [Chloroflexi bacterium]|nr:MAG: hypothetical protein DRI39_08940 [Chloroflexota bacterium]